MERKHELNLDVDAKYLDSPFFSLIISRDQEAEGVAERAKQRGIGYCLTKPIPRQQMVRCLQLAEML